MGTFNTDFEIEQKVQTKFGEKGFVESVAFDKKGVRYWVQVSIKDGRWLRSDEIMAV